MDKRVKVKYSCGHEIYRSPKLPSRGNSRNQASHEDQNHLESQADPNAKNSIDNRGYTGNRGKLQRQKRSRRPLGRPGQVYLKLNSLIEGQADAENRGSLLHQGGTRNQGVPLNLLGIDSHDHNQHSVTSPSQDKEKLIEVDYLCPKCVDHDTDILERVAKRQDFEKDRNKARPPHVKVWREIGELVAPAELPKVPDPFRSSSSWSRRSQSIDEPAESIADAPISRNVQRYLGNFGIPSPPDDDESSNSSGSHFIGPVVPVPKGWSLSETVTPDETWGLSGE